MVKLLNRLRRGRGRNEEVGRLILEADAANRNRDWSTAAQLYGQAVAIDPSLAAIHVQLGHALKEQGFFGRATSAYRRAIALERRNADMHLQLGHVLKLQGRLEEAAAAYGEAKALDAGSADIEREYAATASYRRAGREPGPSPAGRAPPLVSGEILQILEGADLGLSLLAVFDHQFYYFANPELASAETMADPARCLRHFCEHGLQRLSAVAPDSGFDPAFYLATYLAGRPMQPAAAYRHWIALGLPKGWAPNRRKLAESLFGAGAPVDLPDHLLRMGRDAEQNGSWPALVDRLLATERVAGRPTPERMRLIESLVARLARGDEDRRNAAFVLVQRLMQHDPSPGIRHAYAEELCRRSCYLEAQRHFRDEVADGEVTPWRLSGLAVSLDAVGRLSEAFETAARGLALSNDPGLRLLVDGLAGRLIEQSWRLAAEATASEATGRQQHLARILAEVAELTEGTERLPQRPIRRVAIVGNQDLEQCRFYRIDQKREQLARAGFETELFDQHTGLAAFLARMPAFQAVIFYRVPAFYPMMQAIRRARELGLVTFYEIDDLLFDPAHYPGSVESYGGLISAGEHVGLMAGVPMFAAALRLCDFALASTPTLAAAMAPLVTSNRAYTHRNAFGSVHERFAQRPIERPSTDTVTFFYGSGTKAHKEDFDRLVEPALLALAQRYGSRVSIVLVGHRALSETLQSIASNLVLLDPMAIEPFWEALSKVDVNLAVLLPSTMADAKSEIKWMEAAMFAVPTVASDTATYRAVIEPGVTGFLCASAEAWTETLDRLFNDAPLRRQVGEAARARVLERYSLDAAAADLAAIMNDASPATAPQRRPRIVIVNVFYPPTAIGGATRVVHDNVRCFAAKFGDAFEVEVFTSFISDGEPYQTSSYAFEGVRVTGVTIPDRSDIDRVVHDPAMGEAFDRFLTMVRPDLVHFHCIQRLTVAVVEAAQRRKIPYLVTVHDGWWVSGQQFLIDDALRVERYAFDDAERTARELGPEGRARMEALRPALFGATHVLGVSEPFADFHRRCGVPNVMAVPNGISADLAPRPRRVTPAATVRLGFLGGLERHKGSLLIRVALAGARFDHLRLLVVDHAMQPGEHRTEVWGDVPVDLVPKRPQHEVAELYAEIDVLLAPSLWPESYGLVTREALRAGCWVVASDRGSIGTDVIDGENGFVVDVSTVLPLRDVLTRIDRDPAAFTRPPAVLRPLRTSADQADDLARLYLSLVSNERAD